MSKLKKYKKIKKLKICFFHVGFFYSGGGEKLILEEMRALKLKGYEVECFTPILDEHACFPDMIKKFKIKRLLFNLPDWFPEKESMLLLLSCFLFPFLVLRFRKFDIIFGECQPSAWFGFWCKIMLGKKYLMYMAQPTRILYPRPIDFEKGLILKKRWFLIPSLFRLFRPFVSWLDRISIRGAERILVNGSYIAKVIEGIYRKNVINCPAGAYPVDSKKLKFHRNQGQISIKNKIIKKPYLLITNRHFPQKKFEYLFEALPGISTKFPKINLIISGSFTDYTKELKIYARKIKISHKIIWLGFVSEQDLNKLYKNAACYIYTAPEEDFGMGIIEAQALGTPVVAWENAGPTVTVVSGKSGYLAQPFIISDLAEKIIKILQDPQKQEKFGRFGNELVQKKFSYQIHNQKIEKEIINVYKNTKKNTI